MSSPLKTISSEDGAEGSNFAMMTKTLFYISESLSYICINPDILVERLKLLPMLTPALKYTSLTFLIWRNYQHYYCICKCVFVCFCDGYKDNFWI